MKILGVIPARMASSRFPGKPLSKICGLPMIEHVYKRAVKSKNLSALYIATCDDEIKEAAESFGAKVIMTKDTHFGASDRVAEAMIKYEEEIKGKVDAVVMIQGDEPMIFPEMIDQSCEPMGKEEDVVVTNLMSKLNSKEEHEDPNEIKVVVDINKDALYFSREPIPTWKKGAKSIPMLKQVCVITFKRDFLLKFNKWPQSPLEKVEGIDMLRVIENGYSVKMVATEYDTYSVDTDEDLKKVELLMDKDTLFNKYKP